MNTQFYIVLTNRKHCTDKVLAQCKRTEQICRRQYYHKNTARIKEFRPKRLYSFYGFLVLQFLTYYICITTLWFQTSTTATCTCPITDKKHNDTHRDWRNRRYSV